MCWDVAPNPRRIAKVYRRTLPTAGHWRAFADIGRIDHLVLTAGAWVGAPALAELSEALRQTFDVKLFGACWRCARRPIWRSGRR